MSDADREQRDPVVRRAIDELRRLPDVEPEAIRRVVSAAAAARLAPADDEPVAPRRRFPRASTWAVVGVAAAAAFVGFALRGVEIGGNYKTLNPVVASNAATKAGNPVSSPSPELRAVGSSANDALPIPNQFVLHNATAHRISVVGDFNRWNAQSAPMTRSANSTLWSVTIPILPGRHTYGFMIDDSLFLLDPDPRVAKSRDADLGVEGSVVIVGRP
ncbi:MAG TPA: hypothetical protein VGM50_01690 [Gemmatimonadaceae bacterium]|jgi:hypothetical protein